MMPHDGRAAADVWIPAAVAALVLIVAFDLLRLTGGAGLSANVANNLPAYLALEPVGGSPVRLVAILVGVNVGCIITPWASLATLLWHGRLAAEGVDVPWGRFALAGLGICVVALPLSAFLLSLAAR